MAEQLRYEQTLQRLNMPNVDFAAEKEIGRGYAQISAKLDQMSNFFMKQSEGMAKIEGAEYGAENAPTPQQIEDAKSSGKELELPGDKFSVYGQAARSAALTAVYDEIEFTAKRTILESLLQAEKAETDPGKLRDQFNTLIDGYAKTFDETSPALARKFRAEMGLYAYGKISSESSTFLQNEKDYQKSLFASSFELFLSSNEEGGLRTLILGAVNQSQVDAESGTVTEVKTSAETVEEVVLKEKRRLLAGATSMGMTPSQIEKIADAYDARVLQIQSNIVLEEMYKEGSGQRGIFYQRVKAAIENGAKSKEALQLPPSVRSALFSAKINDRDTILSNLRVGWNTIMEDETKTISFNNTIRENDVLQAGLRFNQALVTYMEAGDTTKKANALKAMENELGNIKLLDIDKFKEFQKAYQLHTVGSTEGDISFALYDDQFTKTKYETDFYSVNPKYTMANVIADVNAGKLTFDTYKEILKNYSNLYDEDFKAAIKRLKSALGVPADMYLDKSWLRSQEANIIAGAIEIMTEERRKDTDGTFNADEWVTKNLPELVKERVTQAQGTTIGNQAELVQRYQKYTKRTLKKFMEEANAEGNTERFKHWEKIYKDIEALMNTPGFDQSQLPGWFIE